jgi:hypothetical protein
MGREFLLNERIRAQCVYDLRGVDVVARVFIQEAGDEVQQFDILVAAVELDGIGVGPVPLQKAVKRNDATEETGELPTQIWQ